MSTRASTAAAPGSFTITNGGHAHDHASSGRRTMVSTRNTPASMSSGALVDVCPQLPTTDLSTLLLIMEALSRACCSQNALHAACLVPIYPV